VPLREDGVGGEPGEGRVLRDEGLGEGGLSRAYDGRRFRSVTDGIKSEAGGTNLLFHMS